MTVMGTNVRLWILSDLHAPPKQLAAPNPLIVLDNLSMRGRARRILAHDCSITPE
jgi:hypothetical protein